MHKKGLLKTKEGFERKGQYQNNEDVSLVHDELVRVFYCVNKCLMTNCDASWVINMSASFHATLNRDFLLLTRV